jgi:hypothetical protein
MIPPTNNIEDKVLLVGATIGINDYEKYSVFICPANRFSQPAHYMAFYHRGRIDRRVPLILGIMNRATLSKYLNGPHIAPISKVTGESAELQARLQELVENMNSNKDWRIDEPQKIFFLTKEADDRTIYLPNDIPNDKLSKSGKVTRFVQSQRYLSLAKLKLSNSTSDLEPDFILEDYPPIT